MVNIHCIIIIILNKRGVILNKYINIEKKENIFIAITLFYCLIHTIEYKGDLQGCLILIILAFICKLNSIIKNLKIKSIISLLLLFPYTMIVLGALTCIAGTLHYHSFLIFIKIELELSTLLFSCVGFIGICMDNIPKRKLWS